MVGREVQAVAEYEAKVRYWRVSDSREKGLEMKPKKICKCGYLNLDGPLRSLCSPHAPSAALAPREYLAIRRLYAYPVASSISALTHPAKGA